MVYSQEEIDMAKQQLDEELIAFIKIQFTSFDENYHHIEKKLDRAFTQMGYDGTFQSILFNEEFWKMSCLFIENNFILNKLTKVESDAIEKFRKNIVTVRNSNIDNNYMNVLFVAYYTHNFMINRWDEYYRDEIRSWAESEFGICPK